MNCFTKKNIKNIYNIKNITKKKHNKFIKKVAKTFKNKEKIFQKKTLKKDILKLCTPPPSNDVEKIIKLLDNINVQHSNTKNTKVLWTGWDKNTQLYACTFAVKIGEYNSISKAIEQTTLTKEWLANCGDWNKQETNIINYLKLHNKKSQFDKLKNTSDKIRKDIWDNFSLQFAKFYSYNTLIMLPNKLTKEFLNKTLLKIELPNLNTKNVCIVSIKSLNKLVVNPHLKNKKIYNIAKDKNVFLEFNKFNKKNIINYIKSIINK